MRLPRSRPRDTAPVDDLYKRYAHVVFRRAAQILGSEADAREVTQDVFVSLLERPDQFEGRSAPLTWLYSATTHMCLNRLRNSRTRRRLLEEQVASVPESVAPCTPETFLELRRSLASLPAESAAAAVYFHLDRMSYEEIAAQLGCSRRKVAYLLANLPRPEQPLADSERSKDFLP
jgi:RNA polymerase sigma-70 factor (ECF subfamily)